MKLDAVSGADLAAEVTARLMRTAGDDWVALHYQHEPEVLRSDEAAAIADCSSETIRKWCAEAAAADRPIGVRFAAGVWLVSRVRLLDEIERRHGLSARLAAEGRAKKMHKSLTPPDLSTESRVATRVGNYRAGDGRV